MNSRPELKITTPAGTPDRTDVHDIAELEQAVEVILTDCFFALGQAVGMRKTVEYDFVVWLHGHFRNKFLGAMSEFGNRWLLDRQNVTAVAMMLGERAVRYSEGQDTIGVDAGMKAAADVERYCKLHSRRASKNLGEDALARIAGYWCSEDGY